MIPNTSLDIQAEHEEILKKSVGILKIYRPLVIGYGTYPLLPWLAKPYNFEPSLIHAEKLFNKKLCKAGVNVKRAFGILKADWRCLIKRLGNCIKKDSAVAIMCCVSQYTPI